MPACDALGVLEARAETLVTQHESASDKAQHALASESKILLKDLLREVQKLENDGLLDHPNASHSERARGLYLRGRLLEAVGGVGGVVVAGEAGEDTASPGGHLKKSHSDDELKTHNLDGAEQLLKKAAKLDPSLDGAWLTLAQLLWKKGDLEGAKNCYDAVLHKKPTNVAVHKKTLCQLSMLSRTLAKSNAKPGTEAQKRFVADSVLFAKAAVKLDLNDGYSWYQVGTAYMSAFFAQGATDKSKLLQALKAYDCAEKGGPLGTLVAINGDGNGNGTNKGTGDTHGFGDQGDTSATGGTKNVHNSALTNRNGDHGIHKSGSPGGGIGDHPDLHFNRAVVSRYVEHFGEALCGFAKAQALDKNLPTQTEVDAVLAALGKLHDACAGVGASFKQKKLAGIKSALREDTGETTENADGRTKTDGKIKNVPVVLTHENRQFSCVELVSLTEGVNQNVALRCRAVIDATAGASGTTGGGENNTEGALNLHYVVVDKNGGLCAVSVYGLEDGALRLSATLTLLEPDLRNVDVTYRGKRYEFKLIRVDSPRQILVAGKAPVGRIARPRLATALM